VDFGTLPNLGVRSFRGRLQKLADSVIGFPFFLAKNVAESEGTMRFIAPGKSKQHGFADAGRASQRKVSSRPLLLPKLASR
jgi:hypothetical protein